MKTAAIPSSLRKMNRRIILRHMVKVPAAARGELALIAGTSCVTVGKIVDELLQQGVLENTETKRDMRHVGPGRPGQHIRLNTQSPRFVLVQLGIEFTRMTFAALGTAEDAPWAMAIPTPGSLKEWEKAMEEAWAKMIPRRGTDVWGVLLSMPGIVDEVQGKVLFSPNLHWTEGVDFRSLLRNLTHVPVEMVHEVRALALGQLAASPNQKDFLHVDFGHGVGGAAIINGGIFLGGLPLVGELGHTPLLDNPRQCGCGSTGCMETLMSRRGLFASVQEHNKKFAHSRYSWDIVQSHIESHGVEPWLERSLKSGAAGISGAMNVLGLGRVVITGAITTLPLACDFLAAEIKRGVMWGRFGEVAIEFAPRRRMRGMISVGIERLVVGA